MSKCKVVIIGGASASGKTALAWWLQQRVETLKQRSRVVTLDDFYKPRPHGVRLSKTDDEPGAFDFSTYLSMVEALSQGKIATKPIFDYVRKTRAEVGESINPEDYDFIFIEGILVLHGIEQITEIVSVYVEPESYQTLAHNRAVRDALGQWCDPVSTTKKRELKAGVRDGFFSYILPTKAWAEFKVTNPHRFDIDPASLSQLDDLLTQKESVRIALVEASDEALKSRLSEQLLELQKQIEPMQKSIKARLAKPDFSNNPDVDTLLVALDLVTRVEVSLQS